MASTTSTRLGSMTATTSPGHAQLGELPRQCRDALCELPIGQIEVVVTETWSFVALRWMVPGQVVHAHGVSPHRTPDPAEREPMS